MLGPVLTVKALPRRQGSLAPARGRAYPQALSPIGFELIDIDRLGRLARGVAAILTPAPGNLTFPIMQRLCGPGLAVSDDEALRAMALAFQRLKIVLEPGGAVALAAALFRQTEIEGDAVIVVASGGNVDAEIFARALDTL